jgi:hypothetical protein
MPRSITRAMAAIDFVRRRLDMVEHQIAARGVRSQLVLEAMRKVRREEFLPPSLCEFAYEDSPLPIAEGQTISQPYIVAFSLSSRRPTARRRCGDRGIPAHGRGRGPTPLMSPARPSEVPQR